MIKKIHTLGGGLAAMLAPLFAMAHHDPAVTESGNADLSVAGIIALLAVSALLIRSWTNRSEKQTMETE
ncbi:MAG: hypothetical protein AAF351_09925 [Pseudomonadota bacterium]